MWSLLDRESRDINRAASDAATDAVTVEAQVIHEEWTPHDHRGQFLRGQNRHCTAATTEALVSSEIGGSYIDREQRGGTDGPATLRTVVDEGAVPDGERGSLHKERVDVTGGHGNRAAVASTSDPSAAAEADCTSAPCGGPPELGRHSSRTCMIPLRPARAARDCAKLPTPMLPGAAPAAACASRPLQTLALYWSCLTLYWRPA